MECSCRKKKTKREEFLEIMGEIIPWEEWIGIIRPYYPAGKRGQPPIEIEIMLRMYLPQCWFSLSDEGVEDAIYDSYAMRKFMGINFLEQDVLDATTPPHFRHLLEEHEIGKLFLDAINRCLEQTGRMMRGGRVVDATLISAPSSIKDAEKKRAPETHQTKKGSQWHFGMKCHTGVDAGSGFSIRWKPANGHDVTVAAKLLREDDEVVYRDSAYLGLEKWEEIKQDPRLSAIEYRINRRPGRPPRVSDNTIDWERHIENRKSAVRCKVEHPYRIVKNIFGSQKTDGLPRAAKNLNRLRVLFASANLYMLARAGGSLNPAWSFCAL